MAAAVHKPGQSAFASPCRALDRAKRFRRVSRASIKTARLPGISSNFQLKPSFQGIHLEKGKGQRRTEWQAWTAKTGESRVLHEEQPSHDGKEELCKQEHFDWFDQWYPVAFIKDLPTDRPTTFTVMEQPIVVWMHPGEKKWRAFRDACPHRLVPLSEGRIDPNTGELECPYHGWRFDAQGKCTAIPEGGAIDHRCDAVVFPCTVKQGMLFVKPKAFRRLTSRVVVDDGGRLVDLDGIDTSGIPLLPELEEGAVALDVARDFPYDAALLVENLLDVGHVHFTHHPNISRREKAPVTDLFVDERTAAGFSGGQRNTTGSERRLSEFRAPGFLRHTIDRREDSGSLLLIVAYCVPVRPGHSRLLNRQVFSLKSRFAMAVLSRMPGFVFHPGNNVILDDDVIFLHRQMPEFAAAGGGERPVGRVYRMPFSSDAFVVAFHSWLSRWGGGGPFGPMDRKWLQAAGPQLTREQLLDRYHTHTIGCRSCSAALGFLERAQSALAIGGLAAAVLACLGSLAAAVASSCQASGLQHSSLAVFKPATAWLVNTAPGVIASVSFGALSAAAICLVLYRIAGQQKVKYLQGTWPPPRNLVA